MQSEKNVHNVTAILSVLNLVGQKEIFFPLPPLQGPLIELLELLYCYAMKLKKNS